MGAETGEVVAATPRAGDMPPVHMEPEWTDIEVFDLEGTFASFKERLRREMALNQRIADDQRKKAEDAAESARQHDERAAEIWNLLHAMQRAPVTFPVKDTKP